MNLAVAEAVMVSHPVVLYPATTPVVKRSGEDHSAASGVLAASGQHHMRQGRAVADDVQDVTAPLVGNDAASNTITKPATAAFFTVSVRSVRRCEFGETNTKFDTLSALTC